MFNKKYALILAFGIFTVLPQHTYASSIKEASPQEQEKVFTEVEIRPSFPGGEAEMYKFIATNIKYPATAVEEGVSGRVIVTFVVEKDGSLSNVKVLRGKHPDLDKEAVRVVKAMPKWIPGERN
ncbi:MAG: energy transducer TonB, partial [Muribaculaceae bacterium]|nr:energy transducer TonB [Muribaculaceae bacterium]